MSREYKKIFIVADYDKVEISKEFIQLEQFYLSINPRIRCRKLEDVYTLTVKVPIGDSEKIEFAKQITKEEYDLLKEKRVSKIINKMRHDIKFGNEIGIYDEFFGDFNIKIVSLEFNDEDEMNKFETPDYLVEVGDLISVADMLIKK